MKTGRDQSLIRDQVDVQRRLDNIERRLRNVQNVTGSSPLTSAGRNWNSFTVMQNAINAPQGQSHEPAAIFDPISNKTFFVARGRNGHQYVSYVDHSDSSIGPSVDVGAFVAYVTDSDSHGQACIMLDGDGYIHVVWCAHNSHVQWSKSPAPREIEGTWSYQDVNTVAWGTYVSLAYDETTEAIYAFYRAGEVHGNDTVALRSIGGYTLPAHTGGDYSFPVHEQAGLAKLPDGATGASAWEDLSDPVSGIIDTQAHPDVYSDIYMPKVSARNGVLYLTWCIAHGERHDDVRGNVYAAKYDIDTGILSTMEGVSLGTQITWAEHANCEIYARDGVGDNVTGPHAVNVVSHHLDAQGNLLILFNALDDIYDHLAATHTAYWEEATDTWTYDSLEQYTGSTDYNMAGIYKQGDNYTLIYKDEGGNLEEWTGKGDNGWTKVRDVILADEVGSIYGVAAVISPKNAHRDYPAFWSDWCLNYLDPRVKLQVATPSHQIALHHTISGNNYIKRQPKELWLSGAYQAATVTVTDDVGSGTWKTVSFPSLPTNVTEVYLDVIATFDGSHAEYEILFRQLGVSNDEPRLPFTRIFREVGQGVFKILDLGCTPINHDHELEYRVGQEGDSSPVPEIITGLAFYIAGFRIN
jgi:hypothetical protein